MQAIGKTHPDLRLFPVPRSYASAPTEFRLQYAHAPMHSALLLALCSLLHAKLGAGQAAVASLVYESCGVAAWVCGSGVGVDGAGEKGGG